MYKKIDINNWIRKEHFDFFSKYDEPFFGIVTEVDCTIAYKTAKDNKFSFFAYYLFNSLKAVNQTEEFRCRILNNELVIFDKINASPTIGRDDGTFAFSFIEYNEQFEIFNKALKKEISAVQNSDGLRYPKGEVRNDVVHYSSFPWNTFTGLSHARNFKNSDTVPKITFGKAHKKNNKLKMAVAINAHHGFVDGFHVSKFLNLFQYLLDQEMFITSI